MGIEVGKVYRTKGGRYVIADRIKPHATLSFIECWIDCGVEGWAMRYYMNDGKQWARVNDIDDIVADVGDDEAAVARAEFALWRGGLNNGI